MNNNLLQVPFDISILQNTAVAVSISLDSKNCATVKHRTQCVEEGKINDYTWIPKVQRGRVQQI